MGPSTAYHTSLSSLTDESSAVCEPPESESGPNCEELTQGTYFRVALNNKHGAAERKRPCLPCAAKSLSIF